MIHDEGLRILLLSVTVGRFLSLWGLPALIAVQIKFQRKSEWRLFLFQAFRISQADSGTASRSSSFSLAHAQLLHLIVLVHSWPKILGL